jgi:Uma2 family endonuclease
MSSLLLTPPKTEIEYPTSDGKPMADNTLQWEWIVTIKSGLEKLFWEEPDVFVASDLLWYPFEGDNKTSIAPDVLVALGRPKGHRGCYKQWEEGGVAPQVVFEILSPSNTVAEITRKLLNYEQFGVEEYYVFDPDRVRLEGWQRQGLRLARIEPIDGWISPLLKIRFELSPLGLRIYRPDGKPFRTYVEVERLLEDQERRADTLSQETEILTRQRDEGRLHAQEANEQSVRERERAEKAEQELVALKAKLRALDIDPEAGA